MQALRVALAALAALLAWAPGCSGGEEPGSTATSGTTSAAHGGSGGGGSGPGGSGGAGGGASSGGGSGASSGGGSGGDGSGGSAAGGSGGGGSGAAGSTQTATGPEPTCEEYCDLVTTHCFAGSSQYKDMGHCLLVCEAFPKGFVGETSGNTLGCRFHHAEAAQKDPIPSCPRAGPAGSGACGSSCDGFCTVTAHTCAGDARIYPDAAACKAECAGFPDTVPYSIYETTGDTLACRLFHATAAAFNPETHCPLAAEASAVCQ